jgi:hypothetical protein
MREFDYDMISRYLDGEMGAEEAKAFEELMQVDAELKNEVELYKEVNQTLQMKLHPGEKEIVLRNTLQDLRGEYFAEETHQTRIIPMKRRRWMYAAAAVFIMVIMLTVWAPWQKEDLYTKYASIEMPGVMVRGNATDSLLKNAAEQFNQKNFAAAIPSFEAALKEDPQNSFAQYYYAIALLQDNQGARSREQLTQLYTGTSLFRYDAAYYMGLSYLKEKKMTECREWLNKIPPDAPIYEKAQRLLKKLN